jgi:hypothetical protein
LITSSDAAEDADGELVLAADVVGLEQPELLTMELMNNLPELRQ